MKITYLLIALTASVTCLSRLSAAEATTVGASAADSLGVGSPAPKLEVASWLQGEPVTDFDGGKLYVVEGWATWCGPCIRGIPHLNELHTKFKDRGLVVIGVNVWDGASVEKVGDFVKSRKDMTYRVAYDGGRSGLFAKSWMAAAGVKGIPHAFIVQGGKIIWQGHPMAITDELVGAMLDGNFSPEQEAARIKEAERVKKQQATAKKAFSQLLREKKYEEAWARCGELGEFEKPERRVAAVLTAQLRVRMAEKDLVAANALADQLREAVPESEQDMVVFSYKLPLLLEMKDYEQVSALADGLLAKKNFRFRPAVFARFKLPAVAAIGGQKEAYTALEDFAGKNAGDAAVLTMAGEEILSAAVFAGNRDLLLAEQYAKAALVIKESAQPHLVLAGVAYGKGDKVAGDAERAKVLRTAHPMLKPILEKSLDKMEADLSPKPMK